MELDHGVTLPINFLTAYQTYYHNDPLKFLFNYLQYYGEGLRNLEMAEKHALFLVTD